MALSWKKKANVYHSFLIVFTLALIIGAIIVSESFAAGPSISDAEKANLTLAPNAKQISDSYRKCEGSGCQICSVAITYTLVYDQRTDRAVGRTIRSDSCVAEPPPSSGK